MTPIVGSVFKAQNGKQVYIIHYNVEGDFFLDSFGFRYLIDGKCISNSQQHIIEEWKELKTGVAYINVYDDIHDSVIGHYQTKEKADAGVPPWCKRIACVRVEWKEGQFDD